MQDNIRDYITLSGNHRINILLKIVDDENNKGNRLGFTELSKVCKNAKPKKLGGGTFWHTLKDARIMGLVENGYGFHITEVGKRFFYNFSKEINKEAHLKVGLFRKCFEEMPNETNYIKVRDWFLPHLVDFDKKLKGTVIRRYLEGVYGVNVPKRPRVNIKQYKTLKDIFSLPKSASATAMAIGSGGGRITYFDFLKTHNLSDEKITQILSIISNIPEAKQETMLKLLCKEVKI